MKLLEYGMKVVGKVIKIVAVDQMHVGMPEKEITDAVCILRRLPEEYHVGMTEKEITDAVCILRRLPEEYHVGMPEKEITDAVCMS